MAEWLGSALQKLLQRFESAPDLNEKARRLPGFFMLSQLCSLTNLSESGEDDEDIPYPDQTIRVHIRHAIRSQIKDPTAIVHRRT